MTLRLIWRSQLPIVPESRQERTVLGIILPSQGEAHPHKDHAEHNPLHVRLAKQSNRRKRAQSHDDWGYLLRSMSYYGGWNCGKNLPAVAIGNKPSHERNSWSIGSSKTLNRWPRFRLQLLTRAWACSSLPDTSQRLDRQTRYGTRSWLNA